MLWGLSTTLQVLHLFKKCVWSDEAHSQFLLPFAYQPHLSISLWDRYKCFLIKRNRKAERTVHWSTQQVLRHQRIHVILWPCSDLLLIAMTWAAAQPPWQLQYLLFPLSQMLLRTCSQTMGNMSCRRNISYISSHDTTTTTFSLKKHITLSTDSSSELFIICMYNNLFFCSSLQVEWICTQV